MGGSRAQVNKTHKTRFASKSSRNIHKTSLKDKHQNAKSDRFGKGARAARIQRNNMIRDQKRAAALNEKRALSGSASPPRVIVLFGLSAHVDLNSVERDLLGLLSTKCSNEAFPTVVSSDYKMRATVLKAPHGDLSSCMDMAKVADLVAFVTSASSPCEGGSSDYIDSFGVQCLSVFKAIGLPSTVVLIRDLPSDLKGRNESKKLCNSSLASEFPEQCKFYPADTKDDLHKFLYILKDQRLKPPHWRNQRAYVASQKLEMLDHDSVSGKCTLCITGYIRALNLSVNQLVHVSGAGDYQLSKIDILRDPYALNPRKEHDTMDADDMPDLQVISSLVPDSSKQEPLHVENVPDPLAGEQTWPTEAEMAEAEENLKHKKKRKLPPGTSEYQAAWIVDESDEDDFESNDESEGGMVLDGVEIGVASNDLDEDQGSLDLGESDGETETDSMMLVRWDMTREQIEDDIKRLKDAHAEDEEYPDEVDTPIDVPARKRFAKYRGLKSFRTSSWDPKESLPQEYSRIFAFDNFARTRKHVLAKALERDNESKDETVSPGTYARLYIKEVPQTVASYLCLRAKMMPIISCGLLQHESKMSVLHFSIKKHDSYHEPIKGKEELIFHVGFRQFVARPVFSSDNFNSDKHKMEKFLHAGRFSVASIYAPISFPPLCLVAMKKSGVMGSPVLAAVGSLISVDPDRIILKKIILTGYLQRVSKVKATVRYMFHSPEDVKWFKPVELWTKCGRRGRIKETVGTHGAMKCLFNGVLQQNDTVCMSLFKRAYPKWPEQRFPLSNL
ncbi:pre-rRNA-processing protein TSR1 homolog [Chenopodium quinoa]|uniref:pre-rRNA-processing protein TSR1 homolog n=1 Tax=Chenopodium quinoa TaxID=63459 RepID=UPI000B78D47B|nr:pre-rRNA-processing protein TSR1 homolog [Chenopodium quinoa]